MITKLKKITVIGLSAVFALSILCGFLPFAAFALPPELDNGITWLLTNQNSSGSWGDPTLTEFRDTTVAADALKKILETGTEYTDAIDYINSFSAPNNDYLARKAYTLSRNGDDVSSLIDDLIASQNSPETDNTYQNYPEGGWGPADEYSTNNLDTSLVLDALSLSDIPKGLLVMNKSVNAGETQEFYYELPSDAADLEVRFTEVTGNIEFRIFPNDSSGYSYVPNITSPVTISLSGLTIEPGTRRIQIYGNSASTYSFKYTFTSDGYDSSAVANSIAYLVEAQNGDGGWGLSKGTDSNVYMTSRVLMTLETYGEFYDLSSSITDGIAWLKIQQNPDGGFGADGSNIYETAMSYIALANVDPSSTEAQDALTYLQTAQQVNGSWNDNAFDTAISLSALWASMPDTDNDGVPDEMDNCINTINPDQENCDDDGLGNACDDDDDNDTVLDAGSGIPSTVPLTVADVENVTGTIAVQPPDSYIYFGNNNGTFLGLYGLSDQNFYEGDADVTPAGFFLYVDSQPCACVSINDGDTVTVTFDGGNTLTIYLPAINFGLLYVADDGSTYYDSAMTNLAKGVPSTPGDNCQCTPNPGQEDTDGDGIGDACDNVLPVADPNGPYSGTEGSLIYIDGSGSYDLDGTIECYEWDMDDDGTFEYQCPSPSPTQSYTYAQDGTYTIRLRVTDDLGFTDEATTTAIIIDASPTADFTGDPTSGIAPLSVDFTNNSTGHDTPLNFEWYFDGIDDSSADSTIQNPSNSFDVGTYSILLKVIDSDSSTNTLNQTNYITVCYPLANIEGSSTAYTSFQSAYNAAQNLDTVQSRDVAFTGNVNLNKNIRVTLESGYNCDHSIDSGFTIINGNMTVSDGVLVLDSGAFKVQ